MGLCLFVEISPDLSFSESINWIFNHCVTMNINHFTQSLSKNNCVENNDRTSSQNVEWQCKAFEILCNLVQQMMISLRKNYFYIARRKQFSYHGKNLPTEKPIKKFLRWRHLPPKIIQFRHLTATYHNSFGKLFVMYHKNVTIYIG